MIRPRRSAQPKSGRRRSLTRFLEEPNRRQTTPPASDDVLAVRNPELLQEGVILFENASFHGAHKHILKAEPNLNAPDDNYFNDKVSSLVVFSGQWDFFRNANFQTSYGVVLSKNIYPMSVTSASGTMTCPRCARSNHRASIGSRGRLRTAPFFRCTAV
jgi:hypothetical protein